MFSLTILIELPIELLVKLHIQVVVNWDLIELLEDHEGPI